MPVSMDSFVPPGWSRGSDVPAARIRHGNLEMMQWVAYVAMILDHVGAMMGKWTGEESDVMRGMGRIAFPIFVFVFAWRLANTIWKDPRHDFTSVFKKRAAYGMLAQVAWIGTGVLALPNVMLGFACIACIVVLCQEDRGWACPMAVRLAAATSLALWMGMNFDHGVPGVLLAVSLYSFFRYKDPACLCVAACALVWGASGFHLHTAIYALPVVVLIQYMGWSVERPVRDLFYVLYPLHIIALAAITWSFFPK